MAIELIRQFASNYKVLFLCFNKPLARYVKFALKGTEGKIYVHNCHQWVSSLKRKYSIQNKTLDLQEELEEIVSNIDNQAEKYDVNIID